MRCDRQLAALDFDEQRFRFLEIGCIETLGEPAVDRGEKVKSFGAAALVAAQPGETDRRAQFPKLGLLLPSNAQSFAIKFLGGLGMPLPQQQLAFMPIELCC